MFHRNKLFRAQVYGKVQTSGGMRPSSRRGTYDVSGGKELREKIEVLTLLHEAKELVKKKRQAKKRYRRAGGCLTTLVGGLFNWCWLLRWRAEVKLACHSVKN